jgi:acyl carrier protein
MVALEEEETSKMLTAVTFMPQTFLEAFVDHRHQRGLPATVIHLPPVSGIGLVAETNLIQRLRSTIGAVLRGTEVLTLVEAAILGSSAGLAADGKHLSWSLVPGAEVAALPWEHFNPLSAMRRRRHAASLRGGSASGLPGDLAADGRGDDKTARKQDLKSAGPEVLLSALSDKVSAMTAIERSEITPDRSLLDYGLDSLISLELRNWIRRNFDIDMGVKDINSSPDLRVLAGRILERMKKE